MEKAEELRGPKFRRVSELTNEELTDPDFRTKQLGKLNKVRLPITCSRCHHCRR